MFYNIKNKKSHQYEWAGKTKEGKDEAIIDITGNLPKESRHISLQNWRLRLRQIKWFPESHMTTKG